MNDHEQRTEPQGVAQRVMDDLEARAEHAIESGDDLEYQRGYSHGANFMWWKLSAEARKVFAELQSHYGESGSYSPHAEFWFTELCEHLGLDLTDPDTDGSDE